MAKKKFREMTKPEKRIAVLKDALKMIRNRQVYIDPSRVFYWKGDFQPHCNKDDQLQPLLRKHLKNGGTCGVCERGLLLVSTVLLDNAFKIGQIDNRCFSRSSTTDRRLMKIFSGDQLRLMEDVLMMKTRYLEEEEDDCAPFNETTRAHEAIPITSEKYDSKFYFIMTYPDPTERAAAIIENALANGGTFIP